MRTVHLYSDIGYYSYQHVNQMLYRRLIHRKVDTQFLHRFVMSAPNKKRLVKAVISKLKGRKDSNAESFNDSSIKEIYNLPSINFPIDFLNAQLVGQQIGTIRDLAVTFVPSMALRDIFKTYRSLVYYCVHDSLRQSYHRRNVRYEEDLVQHADYVLCDNKDVLLRLSRGEKYMDISSFSLNTSSHMEVSKYIYVPPPIPECFCELDFRGAVKNYDAIYFGSIHDNIDQRPFKSLTNLGLNIAVISGQRLSFQSENITYFELETDLWKLASLIASSRSILLPYKNSDFMMTVSPAKINQSLVTGLPVLCSNDQMSEKYGLIPMREILIREDFELICAKYELNESSKSSVLHFREDVLLDSVVNLIMKEKKNQKLCL